MDALADAGHVPGSAAHHALILACVKAGLPSDAEAIMVNARQVRLQVGLFDSAYVMGVCTVQGLSAFSCSCGWKCTT